ncbi:unnamed protein product [Caenorhabditis bovis]|uniref:Uncharacterized protein n=1 Tax=Caenorhabditis bovis TaxID=2654633 RepID=A0A8S1F4Z6_9PELO|nr:unnamed protein product [Caenorhabditis bovis]
MGSSQSSTQVHLVDQLVRSEKISEQTTEVALRMVDRKYYIKTASDVYRDLPIVVRWRPNETESEEVEIHFSSFDIIARVVDLLQIKPGQSLLIIGCGGGYLNTVAGFLLGDNGLNHGVDVNPNVIKYANHCTKEFMEDCHYVHSFPFCKPIFIACNGFSDEFINSMPRYRYDRIYISSSVNSEEIKDKFLKLLKVNGRMVLPFEEKLTLFRRTSDDEITRTNFGSVNFASPVHPDKDYVHPQTPELFRYNRDITIESSEVLSDPLCDKLIDELNWDWDADDALSQECRLTKPTLEVGLQREMKLDRMLDATDTVVMQELKEFHNYLKLQINQEEERLEGIKLAAQYERECDGYPFKMFHEMYLKTVAELPIPKRLIHFVLHFSEDFEWL